MKCRACAKQKFIVRTDPKGRCFEYTMGIHKKVEEFDTVDAGTLGVVDTDRGNGIIPSSFSCQDNGNNHDKNHHNPLEKLETQMTGHRKAMTERDAMQFLLNHSKSTTYDDASSNSALRSTYRKERKAKRRRLRNAQDVGLGKGIELHDDNDDMRRMSAEDDDSLALFHAENIGKDDNQSREKEMRKFASIRTTSIFSDGGRRHRKKGLVGQKARPPASSTYRSIKNRVECAKYGNQTRNNDDVPASAHSNSGDNASHQDDTTTMQGGNEQVRAVKLDGNIMKLDGRTAILTKGDDTATKINDVNVSSLLVLGEYDSDYSN